MAALPEAGYQCFYQACQDERRRRNPGCPDLDQNSLKVFRKLIVQNWNALTPEQKVRFQKMPLHKPDQKSVKIKKSKKEKIAAAVAAVDIKTLSKKELKALKKKQRRLNKDKSAPKRPLSAFMFFSKEERSNVKAKNPEFNLGLLSKELSKMWSELDAETKAKYENMSSQDQIRWKTATAVYKKAGGKAAPAKLNVSHSQVEPEPVESSVIARPSLGLVVQD